MHRIRYFYPKSFLGCCWIFKIPSLYCCWHWISHWNKLLSRLVSRASGCTQVAYPDNPVDLIHPIHFVFIISEDHALPIISLASLVVALLTHAHVIPACTCDSYATRGYIYIYASAKNGPSRAVRGKGQCLNTVGPYTFSICIVDKGIRSHWCRTLLQTERNGMSCPRRAE